MSELDLLVREKLTRIADELCKQQAVAGSYEAGTMPYAQQMGLLREYIEVAGEYSVAYESIVATLEKYPFQLTGKGAVRLLEVGLVMKYKTDRKEDALYDLRR